MAADFEPLGELGTATAAAPSRRRGRGELLQDHIEERLKIPRFADGLADLIVNDQLRTQAADAVLEVRIMANSTLLPASLPV